jgi:pilus assembly protein CpaE
MLRFLLKAKTPYSICDALENLHRMDASYWKALVSSHSTHLDLIASPDDLGARKPADPREMSHLMRFIRSVYPVTLVDFGRHFSPAAMDSLPELDTLFVLTTTELVTLDRTRECVSAILARGLEPSKLKVLVNRCDAAMDPAGLESFLGVPPAACFTSDYPSLYDAWSEGRLLDPDTKLRKELNALAASLIAGIKGETPTALPTPQSTPSGIGKWFPGFSKALSSGWKPGKKN